MLAASRCNVMQRPLADTACVNPHQRLTDRETTMSPTALIIRDRPLAHLISVPAAGPAGGLRPVLCFLHGLREAAPMPIQQALTLHGPLNPDNPRRVADRFVIVAPQLPAPGGDVWRQKAAEVQEIVEAVRAQYHGDPDRTWGSGSSPAKSYYKNPRKGIIRVIFRPKTARLGFFGCLLQ